MPFERRVDRLERGGESEFGFKAKRGGKEERGSLLHSESSARRVRHLPCGAIVDYRIVSLAYGYGEGGERRVEMANYLVSVSRNSERKRQDSYEQYRSPCDSHSGQS